MANYWLTQDLLGALGAGFVILVVFGLLAVFLVEDRNLKIILGGLVGLFVFAIGGQGYKDFKTQSEAAAAYRERLGRAMALFKARCETAGEKINRTVPNVEGIYLSNIRVGAVNVYNQFDENDPAGDSAHGDAYIESFLKGRMQSPEHPFLLTRENRDRAYKFVEVPASATGRVFRYRDRRETQNGKPVGVRMLTADLAETRQARYGVEWADISTPADRALWIAGSRIRVVDMQTDEVLAERIGYIVDRGQGSKIGGRQPWTFALQNACPEFPKLHKQYPDRSALTRNFVEKVLVPPPE